jgi:molybdopterin-guanine dinucleotide biosynthesis protein A
MPDGRPLYQHQIDLLARTCPEAPTIYISLAEESQLDDYLQTLPTISFDKTAQTSNSLYLNKEWRHTPTIAIIPDLHTNTLSQRSAGPAAGLCAAHRWDPSKTWLVIACDTHYSLPLHCTTFVARMNRP